MKCCCCVSLQFGTMLFGCIFGLMDFYLGSLGIYYVTRDKMPHVFVKFFDKMDARYCVFWFSVIFYLMAFSDLLLITGAMTVSWTNRINLLTKGIHHRKTPLAWDPGL